MRSHTGEFMTMGTGGAYVKYIKKKLNNNSSNEAELVGVEDFMSRVMWTWYFLKE